MCDSDAGTAHRAHASTAGVTHFLLPSDYVDVPNNEYVKNTIGDFIINEDTRNNFGAVCQLFQKKKIDKA